MKRKIVGVISLVLALVLSMGLFACNSGGSGNSVDLQISGFSLGLGGSWFKDSVERFEDAYAEKVYPSGKVGVDVNVNEQTYSLANINTDGNAIFFYEFNESLDYYAKKGDLLNINEIMSEQLDGEGKSISDKIPTSDRGLYQVDGEYYAAPELEYYASTTYDKNLFDTFGLYFAKPGASGVPFRSTVCAQNYTFINVGDNDNKSCGPDGVYKTSDDGLPSSLYELATLCEYMKTKSISPFALSGEFKNYCNALLNALMCALQGYNASTMFTLESEGFDIITGWTNENLFPGINYIKKPVVATIPITEETGYYTTWSADKYYAEAFTEIAKREGWWYSGTGSDTNSHTETQADFIYSGYGSNEKIGMLVEFSYWYNEATYYNSFNYFYQEFDNVTERDIAFMPMPINLKDSVAEGSGERPTVLVATSGYVLVNANIANDADMMEAVKDFLKFYYSDKELSRTTVDIGIPKSLTYEISSEDENAFTQYSKSLWNLRENGNVVRIAGNTATFKGNINLFQRGFKDGAFSSPNGYRSCFNDIWNGLTSKYLFEKQMIDKTEWGGYYKGLLSVGDYNGLVYEAN